MESDKSVARFQKIFKKHYSIDYSYEEALEARHNLYGFFTTLIEIDREQKKCQKTVKTKSKQSEKN